MHLSEFKAWFKGFTEEMDGPPSKSQWAKIKKQVDEISADYTPAPVFVERYWDRSIRRYWPYEPTWTYLATSVGTSSASTGYISSNAWAAAGKAEYLSMTSGEVR